MFESSRLISMLALMAISIHLSTEFVSASNIEYSTQSPGQLPADLNLQSEKQAASSRPSEEYVAPPSWKPLVRGELVHIPAAKVTCQLVDRDDPKIKDENEAKSSIDKCEKIVFNKSFSNKPIEERIFCLEVQMFGMGRLGDPNARLHAIKEKLSLGTEENAESAENTTPESQDESVIAALEKRFYEKENFSKQTAEDRLLRLEQQIMGKGQSGETHERLLALQKALQEQDDLAKQMVELAKARAAATNFENVQHKTFKEAIDAGVLNFKYKRYHHAQDDFEQALTFNPRSSVAYANLGTTLMTLKEEKDALEAFKACYALEPFGELGQYARVKIMDLEYFVAKYLSGPYDTPEWVAQSQNMINRQAADLSARAMAEGRTYADNRQALAEIESNKIAMETRLTIQGIRADAAYISAYGAGRRRSSYGRFRDPLAEREISDLAQIRTNYIRTDGQVQANNALIEGTNRGQSAFDSAANLKDQLVQLQPTPAAPRLRALGTCLYVRYYGDGMPSRADVPPLIDPPMPELHAVAQLINVHSREP